MRWLHESILDEARFSIKMPMRFLSTSALRKGWLVVLVCLIFFPGASATFGQANDRLTPVQQRIEIQRRRLSSSEVEERRDALMKLGAMRHPDASRAAISALNDPEPSVRVTAAHAIEALPASEAASALLPLLKDKQELVRRETAHALGATRSGSAVPQLIEILTNDKEAAVRAAAAMALGRIGDEAAVVPLVETLSDALAKKKSKGGDNEFLMRAAAQSLGEIRSRAGVAGLIATLNNDTNPIDVRRAAATALGSIGDITAAPALKAAIASNDPYLSQTAKEALRRMH